MRNFFNNERGISLIELVASILLISIILISFFSLFIQSKKAGKTSEEIIDATYVAQETMEYMHSEVRKRSNLKELSDNIDPDLYTVNCNGAYTSCTFTNKTNSNITIKAEMNQAEFGEKLIPVRTQINRDNASPVIMESIWRWGSL